MGSGKNIGRMGLGGRGSERVALRISLSGLVVSGGGAGTAYACCVLFLEACISAEVVVLVGVRSDALGLGLCVGREGGASGFGVRGWGVEAGA